jgi:L-alanine-DL-glutamate epimerase-like enolase superfamily enzyme
MRIVSVAARTIRWSIASRGAARGRSERSALVIEVRTDRGAIGLGEAAPLPGMSRDTLADAERAVAALAARTPYDVPDREAASRIAATTTAAPAARFAIETALLDALARERDISLAALLRAPANPVVTTPTAAHMGAIPSSITPGPHVGPHPSSTPGPHVGPHPSSTPGPHVGPHPSSTPGPHVGPPPSSTAGPHVGAPPSSLGGRLDSRHRGAVPLAAVVDDPEGARRAFAAGIRCLKIKLGPTDDLARVFAIAEAAPGAVLRIDANRSWPRAEVAPRLAALADLPIDYVEEPCPGAHLLLSEPLATRLALDESLASLGPEELGAALASHALAAVVLKPTLLGGLSAALRLAELARRSGVAAIVSHGLEGPVGTAACVELALALGGTHAAGLAAHPALTSWRVEVAQLAPDHVHPVATAGLGFEGLDLTGVVEACSTCVEVRDPGVRSAEATRDASNDR